MKSLIKLTQTESKLLMRNFMSIFFTLAFPTLMLFIFGGIYKNNPSNLFHGKGMVDVFVPALTGLIIAVTGIMSLPLAVTSYRERKILKRFMATPIGAASVLLSQIIVNFALTVVGMIILVIMGWLIFQLHFPSNLIPVMIAFVISVISIFSLGLMVTSLAPNTRAANAASNLVYFPMLFLSGATFPIELLPKPMIVISKFVPLTYVVDLLKGAWLGGNLLDYKLDLTVLVSIAIVATIVSVIAFKWE